MDEETFEIKTCPLCGRSHKYLLRVERSKYLFARSDPSEKNPRRFKRLVLCPAKNEFLETILELKEDKQGTITSVTVAGVLEETGNGAKV